MNIIRWGPFPELVSLRQTVDRLFEDSFVRPSRLLSVFGDGWGHPTLDMYQTEKEVVVKASLPGVKPEEVDITIIGDTLTIRGESKAEEEVKREDYFHRERRYGSFCRSVALPGELKTEEAKAHFEDGVLTITVPKAEEARPKQIKVATKKLEEDKK